MEVLKKVTSNHIFLLLIILLSLFYSHSLFHSGLLPTHDGEYHVIRFFEFDKSFRDGNLYPRWAPDLNNGFGIPLFNYVYPLPNYVALFFHFFGFSFIDSFKLNLLVTTIIGAIFSYLWAKDFWGKLGGFTASVFYTFSPYHSLDLFIRGSVGEAWAFALFPAFLWSVTKVIKDQNHSYILPSSLFLGLIIFSHNILAFMFFFFAICYSVFLFFSTSNSRKTTLKPLSLMFILGVGISSIFWAPAIFERQYVRGLEVYDYSTNFPDLYRLLIPSWGSGFSSGSLQNQLSFQIGIANLLAAVTGILLLFGKVKNKRFILFFIVAFLIVFFLMLKVSLPIWQIFPFMNYFQFPWRFLSLEILFAAFMAGGLVSLPKSKYVVTFAIIVSILLGLGYTNVAYYLERNDNYYTSRSNFIDGTNSPGNTFNTIWIKNQEKQKNKLLFVKGEGKVIQKEIKSTYISYEVNSKREGELLVNIAYFPNWIVYVDGSIKNTSITKNGLFSFPIAVGSHQILIKFEDTPIRKASTIISFISILLLLIYAKSVRMKERK